MLNSIDSGWLKIFDQKAWVFWALTFFFGSILVLLRVGYLPSLSPIEWASDVVVLATVLFASLALASAIHNLANWAKKAILRWRNRRIVLSRLDGLTPIETTILAHLVHNNERSFNTRLDNGDIHSLVQKDLLYQAGGYINVLEVAYTVPDFVWKELKARKNEFPVPAINEGKPWLRNWMTY